MTDLSAEQTMVERCRAQDAEAFGRFVDLYQARVLGFVRRMVTDPEEASDLTQEVFIRAFQHFRRFDGRSTLKTWVFKIAHNLCVDHARRRRRAPAPLSLDFGGETGEAPEVVDHRSQPDQAAIDRELFAAAERAIGGLSDKLRSVLLLHDREDLAYEEIAALLSIPVGTVKSRLFLARNQLHAALSEYLSDSARPTRERAQES